MHHIDIFVMKGMLAHEQLISDLNTTKKICIYFLSLTDFQVLLNFSSLGLEENQKDKAVRKFKAIYIISNDEKYKRFKCWNNSKEQLR